VTRTVSRKPLARLGVAVLLTALLAGCGTATAGSAAVVGGRRISVSDVQAATADIQAWAGGDRQIAPTTVLYFLAIGPYVEEIARRNGAGTSDDDARAFLKARVASPSPAGVDLVRINLSLAALEQKLGQERANGVRAEVDQRLVTDGFEMNPRFGTFDPKTGQVTMVQPNWLVGAPDVQDVQDGQQAQGAPQESAPSPSN
jgi:hypothetical protein